jgi:pilus assembly protein CpaF
VLEEVSRADSVPAGLVARLVAEEAPLLGGPAAARAVERVLAEVAGLGPLEALLADPTVTELMVNGGRDVWVERRGELERAPVRLTEERTLGLIERVLSPLGLRADRSSPIADGRLPDGSRVHAIVPPLAVDGPCLTIRRFGARRLALSDFAPAEVAARLRQAVLDRRTVVISGGTGSGKTTLLNALAAGIGDHERVVTVEDTAELRLPGAHVVRLEARPANAEGVGEVDLRTLVRAALRMRPDRLVVGEVRGAEAFDLLLALNTGHQGSLTTCHANGATDAIRRLETLALLADSGLPLGAVREHVAAAIDLVVQVARSPGGSRRVVEVAEVVAADVAGGPIMVRSILHERVSA